MIQNVKFRRGFTIVELLVVIVTISILATVTVVGYNGIQQRARDTERASDTEFIKSKLESFYAINGRYPTITEMVPEGAAPPEFRRNVIGVPDEIAKSPSDDTNKLGYCWASTPENNNQYCYIPIRKRTDPLVWPGSDCRTIEERCVGYVLNYLKDDGTEVRINGGVTY